MKELITLSVASYALTFVLASSSLFEPVREWIKARTPRLKIGNHKHLVECRMCMGFWCSLAIIIIDCQVINVVNLLSVYGLSYFMATQER